MAASRTIIVAGAGIGGLTASLALAKQGFHVILLEKAERLEEAGGSADWRGRNLVVGPPSSRARPATAFSRTDRLARHPRSHPVAARIYLPPCSALDGAAGSSRDLSDFRGAPDQSGCGRAG